MAYPIKFFSLQKSELEYEVAVRGETPASTVADLRKQINKLSQIYPSEDILCSHLEPDEDLASCLVLLDKINTSFIADVVDKNTLGRYENLLHHLYHRFNRIESNKDTLDDQLQCNVLFKELYTKLINLQKKSVDPLSVAGPSSDYPMPSAPINVNVTCEGGNRISSDLGKLKFNGKTCVRSFIQRANEFSLARNISGTKLLAYATEIFVEDALHWYRGVREQVSTWDELTVLLKTDFDRSDFDYRLLSEIRARTQGKNENITIYLSILSGMFARLSKPLPEEDKLEIVLHNIRPFYANTLASSTQIDSIEQLRSLCRNYENVQSRLSTFREPSAATSDTLAPEFAYKQDSNTGNNNYNSHFNKNFNSQHNNDNKQSANSKPNTTNNDNNKQYLHSINKTNPTNTSKSNLYCPRCRVKTHSFKDCKNTEVICFKCGSKGVKKPDCLNCNKISKN